MKTATLATMSALAALILTVPDFSTIEAQAGVKIRANNKVTPRIRVKPKIRVRVSTKRMLQKKKTSNTRMVSEPVSKTVTPSATKLEAADPENFTYDPAFESAIAELGRRLAHIDLDSIEVPDIAQLDVAAVDLPFTVPGLEDDVADADVPRGGLERPGGDEGIWDPNDVLPDEAGKPDTSPFDVSVDDIGDSITSNRTGRPGDSAETFIKDHGNGVVTETSVEQINRSSDPDRNIGAIITTQTRDEHGVINTRTVVKGPNGTRVTVDNGVEQRTTQETAPTPSAEKPSGDATKLYDPDYVGGGEFVPVNCGSVACNEARKGKGLKLTANPGAQVLPPDPSDDNSGVVGQAPRTDRFWREVATTNPGTEPTDKGERKPVKTSMDQVLPPDPNDPSTPAPGAN